MVPRKIRHCFPLHFFGGRSPQRFFRVLTHHDPLVDKVLFKSGPLAAAAIFALCIGGGVYVFARNPENLYVWQNSEVPSWIAFGWAGSTWSSAVTTLPSAVHVFALSLVTAPLLRSNRYAISTACLLWACLDSSFEFLQLAKSCPLGLSEMDNFATNLACAYVVNGSFDWLDIACGWIGAGIAYLTLRHLQVSLEG